MSGEAARTCRGYRAATGLSAAAGLVDVLLHLCDNRIHVVETDYATQPHGELQADLASVQVGVDVEGCGYVAHHDRRALRRHRQGMRAALPPSTTGDQRNPPIQLTHHLLLSDGMNAAPGR
jgi:hypothetical protein